MTGPERKLRPLSFGSIARRAPNHSFVTPALSRDDERVLANEGARTRCVRHYNSRTRDNWLTAHARRQRTEF